MNKFESLITHLIQNNHDFNVKHDDDSVSVRIWTATNQTIVHLAKEDYNWSVIPYSFGLPITPESVNVIIPKKDETDA